MHPEARADVGLCCCWLGAELSRPGYCMPGSHCIRLSHPYHCICHRQGMSQMIDVQLQRRELHSSLAAGLGYFELANRCAWYPEDWEGETEGVQE